MELTPEELLQVMFNPDAPLPLSWPAGPVGVFLLFTIMPMGAGIPIGIIMARDAGISPLMTLVLYALSDVVGAVLAEPYVMLMRWLARKVTWIGNLGKRIMSASGAAGFTQPGPRGPLGIVLVSLIMSMSISRFTAAAAGHGAVMGWTLAILGDLLYFLILMASTLWLSSVIGNERTTIGIVLGAMWLLPMFIRKWQERNTAMSRPGRVKVGSTVTSDSQQAPVRIAPRLKGTRAQRKRARLLAGPSN